jgi:hypothetical protein
MNNKIFLFFITILLIVCLTNNKQYAQVASYPTISESQVILKGDSGKWDYNKVHTLSVVEANMDGYKYWGYYGLAYYGGDPALRKAGLVRSNDLIHWEKYNGNPIIKGDCRWPTVVLSNSVFYMFYAEYNKENDSRIVMLSSKDGIHFSHKVVVVPREKGKQNQNPFIYFNKNDEHFYLVYYNGIERSKNPNDNVWNIKIRKSKNINKLYSARSVTLLSSKHTAAAPSIAFFNGKYYLLIEAIGKENQWITLGYESKNIDGNYQEVSNNPVLSNDDACAFQYVFNDELYIFYSHCIDLPKWNWELRMVKVIK